MTTLDCDNKICWKELNVKRTMSLKPLRF